MGLRDRLIDDYDNRYRERIAYEDRHGRQLADPRNRPQDPRRHEDHHALIREQDREDRRRQAEVRISYRLGVAEAQRRFERQRADEWRMESRREAHLRDQERRRFGIEGRRRRQEVMWREEEAWAYGTDEGFENGYQIRALEDRRRRRHPRQEQGGGSGFPRGFNHFGGHDTRGGGRPQRPSSPPHHVRRIEWHSQMPD
ncbi:MAG: hypothetical protein Q9221_008229 [Calogaya cf. arnoldii]